MSRTLITAVTEGQKKQLKRFADDAVDRAIARSILDRDTIQKLIENGDEFQSYIVAGIEKLSASNQFADEEVQSSFMYPKSYKVKGIAEQVNILRKLFPWLGFWRGLPDESLGERRLPQGAEGWFAIPKWERFAPTYSEAVKKVLRMIALKRKFYNYREGQFESARLRQHAKTIKMFRKLGDDQNNRDILIVPAQFGLGHRGRSVRRAREVFGTHECGLGAFAVGVMLLTHPEREVQWKQLHIDCAGDEFAPDADDGFSHAPIFYFYDDDEVKFDAYGLEDANEDKGSASAFLPDR